MWSDLSDPKVSFALEDRVSSHPLMTMPPSAPSDSPRGATLDLLFYFPRNKCWPRVYIDISAGRNINNLRCADGTTVMAEIEEELKSLLMKVKEKSEKVVLKLNIQKMKIMVPSGPITLWQIDGETRETVRDFTFWGLQNCCRWWLQPWN